MIVKLPALITAVPRSVRRVADRASAGQGIRGMAVNATPNTVTHYNEEELADIFRDHPNLQKFNCAAAGQNYWCACLDRPNYGKYQCCSDDPNKHYFGCDCSSPNVCARLTALPTHA
jgi:hypothetical protein